MTWGFPVNAELAAAWQHTWERKYRPRWVQVGSKFYPQGVARALPPAPDPRALERLAKDADRTARRNARIMRRRAAARECMRRLRAERAGQ